MMKTIWWLGTKCNILSGFGSKVRGRSFPFTGLAPLISYFQSRTSHQDSCARTRLSHPFKTHAKKYVLYGILFLGSDIQDLISKIWFTRSDFGDLIFEIRYPWSDFRDQISKIRFPISDNHFPITNFWDPTSNIWFPKSYLIFRLVGILDSCSSPTMFLKLWRPVWGLVCRLTGVRKGLVGGSPSYLASTSSTSRSVGRLASCGPASITTLSSAYEPRFIGFDGN